MIDFDRTITWSGSIDSENLGKIIPSLVKLRKENPKSPITLLLHSSGGNDGTAFAFYDLVRGMKIKLHTVALGYADSAAITVFMTGIRRLVGPHTTMFFHPATRNQNSQPLAAVEAIATEMRRWERSYLQIMVRQARLLTPKQIRTMETRRAYSVCGFF